MQSERVRRGRERGAGQRLPGERYLESRGWNDKKEGMAARKEERRQSVSGEDALLELEGRAREADVMPRGGNQGAGWTVWAFGVVRRLGFTLSVARDTKQVT